MILEKKTYSELIGLHEEIDFELYKNNALTSIEISEKKELKTQILAQIAVKRDIANLPTERLKNWFSSLMNDGDSLGYDLSLASVNDLSKSKINSLQRDLSENTMLFKLIESELTKRRANRN